MMGLEAAYAHADLAEDMLARHGDRITSARARALHQYVLAVMKNLEEAVGAENAVYEYRVLCAGRHFPEVVGSLTFRSDDAMWQKWTPDEEGIAQGHGDLSGVEGIVEATAREAEAEGALGVRIERRLVSAWKEVER